MSRRRRHDEDDEPASPEVSRLLVVAYLIAAAVGLIAGVIWVLWHLLGGRLN
jgi:hypothetical protein